MLRRKLWLNLCPTVVLLVITVVAALVLLQGVLSRVDQGEQRALAASFRWILVGLGLVFVVVINFSVIMLIRMSSMILRPVDVLVKATRELEKEHFDHRVTLAENDEFDDLAHAYNRLAEHLQSSEQKRMEVLGQVALTLNHELNNAMATIELQLGMLGRRASSDTQAERRLHTIHDNLARMKDTVQSLKSVRRIVLTEYGQGMKMLDLAQSTRDEKVPSA